LKFKSGLDLKFKLSEEPVYLAEFCWEVPQNPHISQVSAAEYCAYILDVSLYGIEKNFFIPFVEHLA